MMKNSMIIVFVIGAILSSCTNIGNKVETKDAEQVEINKSEAAVNFKTVKSESRIDWRASHLGGIEPRFGIIKPKSVDFIVADEEIVNASIEIDMSTFTADNFEDEESKTKLVGHLQSADFFDVDNYPTSKFELTKIEKSEGDFNSLVTGNLTILGVTKSITFNANISVQDNEIKVLSEDFSVDRQDWGLSYNTEGTEGVPTDYIIADDIGFTIDLIVTK